MLLFFSFLPRVANHISAFVRKVSPGLWKPITLSTHWDKIIGRRTIKMITHNGSLWKMKEGTIQNYSNYKHEDCLGKNQDMWSPWLLVIPHISALLLLVSNKPTKKQKNG